MMRIVILCVWTTGCFFAPTLRDRDGSVDDGSVDAIQCGTAPAPIFAATFDDTGAATTHAFPDETGTLMGGAELTAMGHRAGGLELTGGHVDFGSPGFLDDLSELSVCVWVTRSNEVLGDMSVVDKSFRGVSEGWKLYLERDDATSSRDFAGMLSPKHSYKSGATSNAMGEWHQFCGTWSGGATAASISIYRDGIDDGAHAMATPGGGIGSDADFPLRVGGGADLASGTEPMIGTVDDLMIFGSALTSQQVAELFTCTQ